MKKLIPLLLVVLTFAACEKDHPIIGELISSYFFIMFRLNIKILPWYLRLLVHEQDKK